MPFSLVGLTLQELQNFMQRWNEPSYRGDQLAGWLYKTPVASFDEMTNISIRVRERLKQEMILHPCKIETIRVSQDGTRKYLLSLHDSELIEAVFIPEEDRRTVCVSSQVGCKMGCTFCATGAKGFYRNLTAGEILDQILQIALDVGEVPSNVVFMGMGEPLANYGALLKAIQIINAPWGFNIGIRQLTVSTCGLIPGIQRLGREKLGLTLAVSLHAADDEKRSRIMPINRVYGLDELMVALRGYVAMTGRRVTVEYALMAGFNDKMEDAAALARLLKGLLCHINLIPINPIRAGLHQRPRPAEIEKFQAMLQRDGLTVSIRKERGEDIEAACGQLKGEWEGVDHEASW
ncbi:MAG: 23S rRNA (adenine(2503)-C(2))-methyltransferase RlmN [Firmicutes bacterium]|nr:23S rRNA (adenine(2503)-C(2))-methyltransferase RlmN [Bacillota bacterium]